MTSRGIPHEGNFYLRKTLQNLEFMFKVRKFSGEDPIFMFDCLARLVKEADTLELGEGELIVLLPHLLSRSTAD